jgi:hypothetical protein
MIDACLLVGLVLFGAGGSYTFYARKWFTGPKINLSEEEIEHTNLEKDRKMFNTKSDDIEGSSDLEKKKFDGADVTEVEIVSDIKKTGSDH